MSQTGADYPFGQLYSYQDANEDKNHNHMADPKTGLPQARPGMILSDSRDNALWHKKAGAGFLEILQGEIVCWENEIMCANNEVLFLGYMP